jgi:antitoxin component YwqK of YwqJK toxin-antitoxin module
MKTIISFPLLLLFLVTPLSWCQTVTGFGNLFKKDGLWYERFADAPFNGEVKGQVIGKVINGKREGPWVWYHGDGQLYANGQFESEQVVGYWVHYHENGNKWMDGHYKNGEKDGTWYYRYENGNLSRTGSYKNGEEVGEWLYFDTEGVQLQNQSSR